MAARGLHRPLDEHALDFLDRAVEGLIQSHGEHRLFLPEGVELGGAQASGDVGLEVAGVQRLAIFGHRDDAPEFV